MLGGPGQRTRGGAPTRTSVGGRESGAAAAPCATRPVRCCRLSEPLRASLRTTNLLERAFRELRRRLRPIGALADRRSADRILYGGVLRLNELLAARPLAAFTQES